MSIETDMPLFAVAGTVVREIDEVGPRRLQAVVAPQAGEDDPRPDAASGGEPEACLRRAAKAKPRRPPARLTDEEQAKLAGTEVSKEQMKKIAGLHPEARARAVARIAGGMPAVDALSNAYLPDDVVIVDVVPDGPQPKTDDELTDDEWLERYCSEILAKLKFAANFRRDAILYRRTREARARFRSSARPVLAQGKAQVVGPFFHLIAKLVNVDHPAHWLACGPCGGSGMDRDLGKCGFCYGHAYTVTREPRR